MCAVTSALGGSVTAPKSQNGSLQRQLARVVDVERAPAAALALHPERPREAAVGGRARGRVAVGRAPQREHDDGRVVDVGVVVVRELEREAAGRDVRPPHGPVAADLHLAAGEPARAALDRLVVRREARVEQRDQRERRVPHRRLARLDPAALVVLRP